jgi:hypothetical protein
MKLRHFRGTKELPWIANDETYDFDYQDNRNLNDIMIMRGDQLALGKSSDNYKCKSIGKYHVWQLQIIYVV